MQHGAASRKYPAARPLDDHEMPDWLRNEDPNGGQPQRGPAGAAGYPSRASKSWNGYDEREGYDERAGGQRGRNGQRRPNTPNPPSRARGQRPGEHTDHSWAAPDGYEQSPWDRPRPTQRRQAPQQRQQRPPAKKRKGGFFGFLRRG